MASNHQQIWSKPRCNHNTKLIRNADWSNNVLPDSMWWEKPRHQSSSSLNFSPLPFRRFALCRIVASFLFLLLWRRENANCSIDWITIGYYVYMNEMKIEATMFRVFSMKLEVLLFESSLPSFCELRCWRLEWKSEVQVELWWEKNGWKSPKIWVSELQCELIVFKNVRTVNQFGYALTLLNFVS